jgi:hypothetical protein
MAAKYHRLSGQYIHQHSYQSRLCLGGKVKVEAGVEPVETQLTLEVVKGGRLGLLRLSEVLLRLSEGLLRLSEGLLRLSEGLGGKSRLEGLLLSLTPLLELEGGVWLLLLLGLLREEGGGRLSEGWLGCWLLGGEQLGVGGVGWVNEGVHSLTVGTGGH